MAVSRTRLLFAQGSFVIFGLGMTLAPGFVTAADSVAILADSPSTYTVVRGDTLWDISGKFLEQPWLWPRIWERNPQISNPDLIYPGDLITLVYIDGQPVLRLSRNETDGLRTVKLTPEIRRETIGGPISAIPLEKISSYLSPNYVVSTEDFENAPYIVAERFGNTVMSPGDNIFARGEWPTGVYTFDIVHNGRNLIDPDTQENMGVEGIKIGSATISKTNGEEAILEIDAVTMEVRVGDRFIASQPSTLDANFMPLPPDFAVDAAIITLDSGRDIGGLYDTLILNRGQKDGIQVGQLLTVEEPEVEVHDPMAKAGMFDAVKKSLGKEVGSVITFPGETIASVLVYKVFEETSFALVLKTSKEIRMGDRVVTP